MKKFVVSFLNVIVIVCIFMSVCFLEGCNKSEDKVQSSLNKAIMASNPVSIELYFMKDLQSSKNPNAY